MPVISIASLMSIEAIVRQGFDSQWGPFPAEGVVCKPKVEMHTRAGRRIIVKLKTKDFA